MQKILIIFGTRPEAIKLASVIQAFRQHPDRFELSVCVTSQHRSMLDQVLDIFDIQPDHDLDLMKSNQHLSGLTSALLLKLQTVLSETSPDWILVQGDTTTAFAASLAAYYNKIKIGHVEAGLRTHDKWHPYPEEINRRLTGILADVHFAATEGAKENLLQEGVSSASIHVVGNTVIDALLRVRDKIRNGQAASYHSQFSMLDPQKKLILVTSHRRESFGKHFEDICLALRQIIENHKDVEIVYPVHLNPNIREPAHRLLRSVSNIHLIDPVDYEPFVYLMDRSYLILTDSGGIQEEAPSLGKPVLVMREKTERPEGVLAGASKIVGRNTKNIVDAVSQLLENSSEYQKMSHVRNPYGDGRASDRIVSILSSEEKA